MLNETFPEYSAKYSEWARKTRLALPPAMQRVADEIESELLFDPNKYPERTSPASVDGTSRIYRHPDPELQVTFQVDEAKKVLFFFHYFAPMVQPPQTIFISYSHNDKQWLDKLKLFLSALEQQGLIKFWDDGQLQPGIPWEQQIRDVLKTASAGLLLVSQEFLASKFVKDVELPQLLDAAIEKGKKIYWLQLSPTTVFDSHPEITRYQSILENPKISLGELTDVEQRKALAEVARKLQKVVDFN